MAVVHHEPRQYVNPIRGDTRYIQSSRLMPRDVYQYRQTRRDATCWTTARRVCGQRCTVYVEAAYAVLRCVPSPPRRAAVSGE